jgi:hypothetical protein
MRWLVSFGVGMIVFIGVWFITIKLNGGPRMPPIIDPINHTG